jgi:hypothetical protein
MIPLRLYRTRNHQDAAQKGKLPPLAWRFAELALLPVTERKSAAVLSLALFFFGPLLIWPVTKASRFPAHFAQNVEGTGTVLNPFQASPRTKLPVPHPSRFWRWVGIRDRICGKNRSIP